MGSGRHGRTVFPALSRFGRKLPEMNGVPARDDRSASLCIYLFLCGLCFVCVGVSIATVWFLRIREPREQKSIQETGFLPIKGVERVVPDIPICCPPGHPGFKTEGSSGSIIPHFGSVRAQLVNLYDPASAQPYRQYMRSHLEMVSLSQSFRAYARVTVRGILERR